MSELIEDGNRNNSPSGSEISIVHASSIIVQKNTFSPKNDPKSKRLLWIEPEALRLCLKEDTLALDEIVVLEEFGK